MGKEQKGFSTIIVVLLCVLIGVSFAGWQVWQRSADKETVNTDVNTATEPAQNTEPPVFANPKKGAHFETSTPAHESVLPGVPVDLVIDFNFDLADNSTIKIQKDGKDFGTGDTKIDAGKLAMRRQMDLNAPDGLYTVTYNGCWPDKSCHDGHFQFAINRSLINSYQDQRGGKEASILMSQSKFQPVNVRIGVGQTLTWINDDVVEHYVNTDSHPAHTHVPGLNSRALAKGATYSYNFSQKGVYLYHCSAHAADMVGIVVVE